MTRNLYNGLSTEVTGVNLLTQYAAAIEQLQSSTPWTLSDVSGANAVTANVIPALGAEPLAEGMQFMIKWVDANTGPMTLAIDGGSAKSILDSGGAALTSGATSAGSISTLYYDGTAFRIITSDLKDYFNSQMPYISRVIDSVSASISPGAISYDYDVPADANVCEFTFKATLSGATKIGMRLRVEGGAFRDGASEYASGHLDSGGDAFGDASYLLLGFPGGGSTQFDVYGRVINLRDNQFETSGEWDSAFSGRLQHARGVRKVSEINDAIRLYTMDGTSTINTLASRMKFYRD